MQIGKWTDRQTDRQINVLKTMRQVSLLTLTNWKLDRETEKLLCTE